MPEIPAGPDLDLSLLNEIADGSNEFIVDSIDMFLQQTPESIQHVEDAMNAGEWINAGLAAHKMKSTLGFFGMLVSQALVQQVEASLKSGAPNEAEVRANFNIVKANIAQNTQKLLQFKKEASA